MSEPTQVPARTVTGPQLYAMSLGEACDGPEECHWCGAPCPRLWTHDGPIPIPFVKNDPSSQRPGNPWICRGCWLFRRKRITVRFLKPPHRFKDGQCGMVWSWWMTDKEAWAVSIDDRQALYDLLLKPPKRFCLSLVDLGNMNLLQLARVNDFAELKADTELAFTLNNVHLSYTVYDLENAVTSPEAPYHPGIRSLLEWLGPWQGVAMPVVDKKPGKPGPVPATEHQATRPGRKIA